MINKELDIVHGITVGNTVHDKCIKESKKYFNKHCKDNGIKGEFHGICNDLDCDEKETIRNFVNLNNNCFVDYTIVKIILISPF